ncbi:MAG: 50S ribosomal protein L21 [Hyphomicrobiaceae bacterium]
MYAVIKTGGKQYRVAKDDIIEIEKLDGNAGDTIAFTEVLMLGGDGTLEVGKPLVAGATVAGEVVEQTRGDKVIIFKKRRRHNYRRKKGHRQDLTVVRITDILTGGARPQMKKGAPKTVLGAPAGGRAFATLKSPDGRADDLSLISGVGKKINERLKSAGIFHYWQIAAFTDADIENVEKSLAFKGRIRREEWVEQARELMDGKPPRAKVDQEAAAARKAAAKN